VHIFFFTSSLLGWVWQFYNTTRKNVPFSQKNQPIDTYRVSALKKKVTDANVLIIAYISGKMDRST
jgi:hypothetical protein